MSDNSKFQVRVERIVIGGTKIELTEPLEAVFQKADGSFVTILPTRTHAADLYGNVAISGYLPIQAEKRRAPDLLGHGFKSPLGKLTSEPRASFRETLLATIRDCCYVAVLAESPDDPVPLYLGEGFDASHCSFEHARQFNTAREARVYGEGWIAGWGVRHGLNTEGRANMFAQLRVRHANKVTGKFVDDSPIYIYVDAYSQAVQPIGTHRREASKTMASNLPIIEERDSAVSLSTEAMAFPAKPVELDAVSMVCPINFDTNLDETVIMDQIAAKYDAMLSDLQKKLDHEIIHGTGQSEPLGIFNTAPATIPVVTVGSLLSTIRETIPHDDADDVKPDHTV